MIYFPMRPWGLTHAITRDLLNHAVTTDDCEVPTGVPDDFQEAFRFRIHFGLMALVFCFSLRRLLACDGNPIDRFGLLNRPYAFVILAFIAVLCCSHLLPSPTGQRFHCTSELFKLIASKWYVLMPELITDGGALEGC